MTATARALAPIRQCFIDNGTASLSRDANVRLLWYRLRVQALEAICTALDCQPGDILRFEAEGETT